MMLKTKTILILLVILSLLIFGCNTEKPVVDDSEATAEGVQNLVDANNNFAFDLLKEFENNEDGNIFFSPYSLESALMMTYEGAKGETATQMKKTLRFTDEEARKGSFAKIHNIINKEDKEYELNTANALWVNKDFSLLDEFTSTVSKYYGGGVTEVDYSNPAQAAEIINSWIEEKTNNKIKDLVPENAINSMTKLILTNAIYFKGQWQEEFDKKNTRKEDFFLTNSKEESGDNAVSADMMRKTADFKYGETPQFRMLEIPYKGEEISMLLILPKSEDERKKFLEENPNVKLANPDTFFNWESIKEVKNTMRNQEVFVKIPKFKFETKYFMKKNFERMGMQVPFTDDADFSGMAKTPLKISEVIHQAFIEVNEEGTEAAAATAVVMTKINSALPMSTPEFIADHPFYFVIQENETGAILFVGYVEDPSSE